jgi:hypothetical protein
VGGKVKILNEENVNFASKNFKLLRQSTRKVNEKLRLFLKFVISVGGGGGGFVIIRSGSQNTWLRH